MANSIGICTSAAIYFYGPPEGGRPGTVKLGRKSLDDDRPPPTKK